MMKYIGIFCCISMALSAQTLQKVYNHTVDQKTSLDQTPHVELEKLVFYFDHDPEIHTIVHNDQDKTGWKHESYFFTFNDIASQPEKKISSLQKKGVYYQIACTPIHQPKKGMRVELMYDPKVIACACDTFDAITQHKGVTLRLINKSFINRLKSIDKPLIEIADNSKHIIIDPGHGGQDTGAIGYCGLAEKDVTLAVGTTVADLLKKKAIL